MGSTERGGGSAPVADRGSLPQGALVDISARSYWRAVGVVLLTLFGLWAIHQARGLVTMLVISLFFALALVPGVNHFHEKRGWKRGAAVGFIYLVGLLAGFPFVRRFRWSIAAVA